MARAYGIRAGGGRGMRALSGRRKQCLAEALEGRVMLAGTLSVGDASVVEGDSGTVETVFTVTRSGDVSEALDVSYNTSDGTAVAGTDYLAQTGTAHFAAGAETAAIAVTVLGNTLYQSNRTFSITVWDPANVWLPAASRFAEVRSQADLLCRHGAVCGCGG